jgi:hypothetical protein
MIDEGKLRARMFQTGEYMQELANDEAALDRATIIRTARDTEDAEVWIADWVKARDPQFSLERRIERQRLAMQQALFWLHQGAPGRAAEVLEGAA